MTVQHIGCTIYFHTSKRYNTTHIATTSSWNVSSFCGVHQPFRVRLVMSGIGNGIPEMVLGALWRLVKTVEKSSWRPNLPPRLGGIGRLGGTPGLRNGPGTGLGLPVVTRGGVGNGRTGPDWGSASTMAAKATRARITCQIESMIFSIGTCSVLCVGWIIVSWMND